MKLTFTIAKTIEILRDEIAYGAFNAEESAITLAKLEAGESLDYSDLETLARTGLAEWQAPEVADLEVAQIAEATAYVAQTKAIERGTDQNTIHDLRVAFNLAFDARKRIESLLI